MEKVWVPICIERSTYPITTLLEPLKAFTIKAQGFKETPSRVNFINVIFGMMFKEDLVSTNTQDMIVSIDFIKMYRALLCALPFVGSSLSSKPRKLPAEIFVTTPLNWSIVISFVTWDGPKTFIKDSQCPSELNNNDKIEIFDGVWFKWSTIR